MDRPSPNYFLWFFFLLTKLTFISFSWQGFSFNIVDWHLREAYTSIVPKAIWLWFLIIDVVLYSTAKHFNQSSWKSIQRMMKFLNFQIYLWLFDSNLNIGARWKEIKRGERTEQLAIQDEWVRPHKFLKFSCKHVKCKAKGGNSFKQW